jgi:MoxR-like ATPase
MTAMLDAGSIAWARERTDALLGKLNEALFGQEQVVRETVCALLARGHVLLEGLPGLGKTELVKSLGSLLSLDFKRIQFTPDLLPTDITGTHVIREHDGRREFDFHPGPIFTHILLADEINRASPKTQAALLEAMQERRATILGTTHTLPDPFFVLATQNPIELEGTYPLPEAQLDRFLFKVEVPGVGGDVLLRILSTRVHGAPPAFDALLAPEDLARLFELVDQIVLPEAVARYVARLVEATHPTAETAPAFVKEYVRYGASPRAAIAIGSSARALAIVRGKPNVGFDEVKDVAEPAVAHRLVLQFSAQLEQWSARRIVRELVGHVSELEGEIPATLRVPATEPDEAE